MVAVSFPEVAWRGVVRGVAQGSGAKRSAASRCAAERSAVERSGAMRSVGHLFFRVKLIAHSTAENVGRSLDVPRDTRSILR